MSVHLITSLIQGTQSCSPYQSACCKCTIFSQHILPSFLSSFPSTLMLEVVGGIARATFYLDRRKCLNLFALQGQVLHLLLYPCARPAFLLLCAGCFGLSFCSAALRMGRCQKYGRGSRVCVCVCCFLLPPRRCVCPSFPISRYLLKRTGNLFLVFHQVQTAKCCWNGLVFEAFKVSVLLKKLRSAGL